MEPIGWKCARPDCDDRAVVFPVVRLRCPCGHCDEAQGTIIPGFAVVMPVPICGPCSTIATPKDLLDMRAIGFIQGNLAANMPHVPTPQIDNFKLEMRPLEHFIPPSASCVLPPKNWMPKSA